MRRILVSYARSQQAQKFGGGRLKIDLDEAALVSLEESKETLICTRHWNDWPHSTQEKLKWSKKRLKKKAVTLGKRGG